MADREKALDQLEEFKKSRAVCATVYLYFSNFA